MDGTEQKGLWLWRLLPFISPCCTVPTEAASLPSTIFSVNSSLIVKCGVRRDTGPSCNAVGMIDRKILGIQHLYKRPIYSRTKQCSINSPDYAPLPPDAPSWCRAPFDPEGLLSSVMAIVTCLIGLHYGHIIVHLKDHRSRLSQWMIASFGLVLFGVVFDFSGMHINKALYTVSYVCITAGAAGILFAGIYVLVDMYGYKRSIVVLEWMGMNALVIYILIACNILPVILQGFYWGRPQNNIALPVYIQYVQASAHVWKGCVRGAEPEYELVDELLVVLHADKPSQCGQSI
ncbi:hypothetical protein RJ639_019846 [Escallonia herrerae]|uniref:Heparan-alpha-glucosaminide N-acetyltransferase n=1 Tax=Escallonia herrerae TaxID=1293975 RepID=A0AA89AIP2_9ASTE|nr:hypothetical protein RJ639_019846 [Escallonia herrerae]